jgi:hypothetical protein
LARGDLIGFDITVLLAISIASHDMGLLAKVPFTRTKAKKNKQSGRYYIICRYSLSLFVFVPVLFFGVPPLGVYFENMNDGVQRRAKAVEFLVLFFFSEFIVLLLLFYF